MSPRETETHASPNVVDLFAGCGGLSLGFAWAGCLVRAAVEIDADAARTHHENFKGTTDKGADYSWNITSRDTPRYLETKLAGASLDILIGGPPCQAFARIGRAKLREVARGRGDISAEQAHLEDDRGQLWRHYMNAVRHFKPRAILMENVPDILNQGGTNVVEQIREKLHGLDYESSYTLLNAAHYGVPQYRERMFLVAFHKSVDFAPDAWLPPATHHAKLPVGYRGTRSVATKVARNGEAHGFIWHAGLQESADLLPSAQDSSRSTRLSEATTAAQAFSGIPHLDAAARGRGIRRLQPADNDPTYARGLSAYVRALNGRPSPRNCSVDKQLSAHVTRHLPRDGQIFERMIPGQDYVGRGNPVATGARPVQDIAVDLLAGGLIDREVPYADDKFPNKWWRMREDRPSRTLTAHMGKDTYSHIHPTEPRTISVREAARLQSFPDWFRFPCSMNAGFRMIGNAVPPLLAEAIANQIVAVLNRGANKTGRKTRDDESATACS